MTDSFDVVVVGAGLAGLAAALAAREEGASVCVLERAPEGERGGNTRFSNGAMRAVYSGLDEIIQLVGEISEAERSRADFGHYSREEYYDHMGRITQYRTDPAMCEILVARSSETMHWLRRQGVRFLPLYEWQFKTAEGRVIFSGGSALETYGAGDGLSSALFAAAARAGVTVHYNTRALSLCRTNGVVGGVKVFARDVDRGKELVVGAKSVVVAAGGFEANPEWRARYLGPGWELAKVRGSRFNTGDGLRMVLDAGGKPYGNWSGCHSASWDLNAPDANTLEFGTVFKRDDFANGIMVNARGRRFVDEGADVGALTYAKMGRAILAEPNQIAWQIYDAKAKPFIHGEYRNRQAARFQADTIEALAGKLEGIDQVAFVNTVNEFNASIPDEIPFDSGKKDGRTTRGLPLPKSNWARALDTPPFEAWAVTCGITFTFGGVQIDTTGQVLDVDNIPIPGLFAAGEMVGGIFYFNYPGGAGLMSAAVFGRLAGMSAAKAVASKAAAA
jgi:tricarballylate dehydrogenase